MNASEQITKYIHGLADWRGRVLEQLRNLINEVAPSAVEDWNEEDLVRAAVALNSGERKAKDSRGSAKGTGQGCGR